jgi:hypothetical protein
MRFRATISLDGKTATGIPVPPEIITGLGKGKRLRVRVTINGHTYRSTVGSMRGQALIPLSADNRNQAGVAAGDEIDVDIEPDTEPREVTVPPELADALDRDPDARHSFDALSHSGKQRIVTPIEDAKTAETRQRRIGKAIFTLRTGSI